MAIAMTMHEYLDDNHAQYDVMRHKKTSCSTMTVEAAHVPGRALAKGVVVKWDGGYVLSVLPASRQVDMARMSAHMGGPCRLATEEEASRLFPDCEIGAIPVFGVPYRVACLVDDRLDEPLDIYFEGGDHRSLIHVSGTEFDRLMYGIPHASISR
jgi:Ala-tRNA(Pro) deacylase